MGGREGHPSLITCSIPIITCLATKATSTSTGTRSSLHEPYRKCDRRLNRNTSKDTARHENCYICTWLYLCGDNDSTTALNIVLQVRYMFTCDVILYS